MTIDVSTMEKLALSLMRSAMEALDGSDSPGGIPACYLQMAIDGLDRQLADGPAPAIDASPAAAA